MAIIRASDFRKVTYKGGRKTVERAKTFALHPEDRPETVTILSVNELGGVKVKHADGRIETLPPSKLGMTSEEVMDKIGSTTERPVLSPQPKGVTTQDIEANLQLAIDLAGGSTRKHETGMIPKPQEKVKDVTKGDVIILPHELEMAKKRRNLQLIYDVPKLERSVSGYSKGEEQFIEETYSPTGETIAHIGTADTSYAGFTERKAKELIPALRTPTTQTAELTPSSIVGSTARGSALFGLTFLPSILDLGIGLRDRPVQTAGLLGAGLVSMVGEATPMGWRTQFKGLSLQQQKQETLKGYERLGFTGGAILGTSALFHGAKIGMSKATTKISPLRIKTSSVVLKESQIGNVQSSLQVGKQFITQDITKGFFKPKTTTISTGVDFMGVSGKLPKPFVTKTGTFQIFSKSIGKGFVKVGKKKDLFTVKGFGMTTPRIKGYPQSPFRATRFKTEIMKGGVSEQFKGIGLSKKIFVSETKAGKLFEFREIGAIKGKKVFGFEGTSKLLKPSKQTFKPIKMGDSFQLIRTKTKTKTATRPKTSIGSSLSGTLKIQTRAVKQFTSVGKAKMFTMPKLTTKGLSITDTKLKPSFKKTTQIGFKSGFGLNVNMNMFSLGKISGTKSKTSQVFGQMSGVSTKFDMGSISKSSLGLGTGTIGGMGNIFAIGKGTTFPVITGGLFGGLGRKRTGRKVKRPKRKYKFTKSMTRVLTGLKTKTKGKKLFSGFEIR